MTSPCSVELLESALTGDLPPDRAELLSRHLEECEACTAALEQMAGDAALWQEAAVMMAEDELDDALYAREEWSNADFTVEHLEAADEPGVLGRLGGYDVLEIIGRGGMGVVLKGFDPELKRCVAIKVLSPHLALSSLAKKRFAREAQAAAAVVHPNVLAIHQVQAGGRLPFLVMPLVAGESLAQRLTAEGRLELKEVLRIGMQAAAGLSAAHEQGLVHRDVKPANILLEKGVERAVLTDFGLARAADDVSMTRWGIIAGTPQYMSPEQARGEPVDGRSDLFSLGCVLYEMATGVSPFRTDSTLATLRRLIDDPPPAMAAHDPELPPWFIGIVERLLEKEPSRRFGSAKEVSELLEGCLAHLQQPAGVPLPASAHLNSPLSRGEGQGVRAAARSFKLRNTLLKGTLAMISTFAIGLATMFAMQATTPPDISGTWQGEGWGQVKLTETAPGEYTGTYSDTVAKEKEPAKIDLKWSRIECRYNGTWREGDDDRFGDLSVHVVGKEIQGALTTSARSKINPATPRLAEVFWTHAQPAVAAAASATGPEKATVAAAPSATGPEKPSGTASPRASYTVTGRALTEPGGSMVAGVEVSLAGRPGNAPRSVGIVGIGNGNVRKGPDALTTAADGSYSFNNLPPGNYMVFTRGRDPRFQPDGVWSEGVSFAIVDRNVRADDLCLKLPQSVSGTVRDADTGEPIARAQIRLRTSDLSKLSTTGPVNATIYADAQGRYRVYARSPKVDLSCDGDSFRYYGADGGSSRSVAVEPGRETTVDFRCKSSPPLAGRVLNPDGTPAKSADVRVWVIWPQRVVTARRGRAFVSFIADSEGRFHGYMRMFTGPAAPVDQGAVSIEAYAWLLDHSLGGVSRAEAPSGEPLARPLEVKLEKTGTAVVRVLLEDGTPAANAEVDALTDAEAEAGAGAIQFSVGGYILPSLQLGAPPVVYLGDGRYRITGLIPGMTWQIRAYPLKPQRAPQIRDIEVKPGQTIDAGEIRLGPEGKPAARAGQGASSGTSPRAASPPDEKPGAAPVIERVTVDLDRAVIEGRASKNDKIVSILFGSIIAHGSGDAKQGVLRG